MQSIINCHHSLSLSFFSKHPDMQSKFYGRLTDDDTLGDHGVRVLNAVGVLVKAANDQDDEKLVGKIHEVSDRSIDRAILTTI